MTNVEVKTAHRVQGMPPVDSLLDLWPAEVIHAAYQIVTCKPLSISSAPLFSFSQSLSIPFTAGKAEAWEGLESQLHKGRDFRLRCSRLEPQQPGTVRGTQERLGKDF